MVETKIGGCLPNRTGLFNYYWQRIRRNKLALAGLAFIVFLIALAVIGPFVTSDPMAVNFDEKEIPPISFTSQQSTYNIQTDQLTTKDIHGTWEHPLGTDSKGSDMLAMLIAGARISLLVGLIATGIAIILGTIIGVVSAYLGGWADNILMRFTDIMMTFPFFLLLVLIVFIFGPSLAFIVLVIGLTGWTGTARMIRSESLSLRTREFVVAAKALGATDNRVVFRHLIPNVASLIIIMATLSIPGVILAEAALSFIGLGDPTVPSWGVILESGRHTLATSWWVAVEPGIMLFLTVLAFNFLGDGLRDAFDPRSNL
ncbi:MAG TPA: ABC transporter permease [Dehalococcoidia bacterium]|jgi:peptide/nickel transport system permease protein